MPLKKSKFIPQPKKKTLPRDALNYFDRNSIGRKYLDEIYIVNQNKTQSKNHQNNKFEVLNVIKDSFDKENEAKLSQWNKYRNHMSKYDTFIRGSFKNRKQRRDVYQSEDYMQQRKMMKSQEINLINPQEKYMNLKDKIDQSKSVLCSPSRNLFIFFER